MNPNTINQVTGILQQVSVLEPAGVALVQQLIASAPGQSAADIADMVTRRRRASSRSPIVKSRKPVGHRRGLRCCEPRLAALGASKAKP